MNTYVTNWELMLILLASFSTIFVVLFIVSKWLNFHFLTCFHNCLRIRKISRAISVEEPLPQVNKQRRSHT